MCSLGHIYHHAATQPLLTNPCIDETALKSLNPEPLTSTLKVQCNPTLCYPLRIAHLEFTMKYFSDSKSSLEKQVSRLNSQHSTKRKPETSPRA
ncbi:hypothetical protein BANRA_05107 [Escherichia coli]|nr:hypothetical protein BANRA_05107 [Escherichia coli]